jgi:DNA polymerase elongation subunit (family B)
MGVHRGYLPFLPGAMCTTAWGRENIQLAAKRLQDKHDGDLVYGDTDSCYIHFPQFDKADKLWDFCLEVEEDISSIFPPPMRMAFEEVIYWQFLILTKKRYMYLDCGRDGIVAEKIGKKGVLLARRDNSAFIRMIYEEVVNMIFERCKWDEVMKHVCDRFNNLCSAFFSHRDFVITKSIGEISEYKVMSKTVLKEDPKKRKKQIEGYYIECHTCDYLNLPRGEDIPKCSVLLSEYENVEPTKFSPEEEDTLRRKLGDCCWLCAIEEWRARKRGLPAHVQLAEKLRRRGQRVDAGERLEYIVTNMDNVKAKLWRKLEHPDYFKSRTAAMQVDYHYYLKLLSVQLDQLIEVAYRQEKFTSGQLKARLMKQAVGHKIKELFEPEIIIK